MKEIDPTQTYSLLELARMRVFPGRKSYAAVKTLVMRDRLGANVLKPQILGEGRATRVYIKGSNLLTFLKQK